MTVYSSVGYCSCGQEVWIEYVWDGESWKPHFQNVDHEIIERCPNCNRQLNDDDLESL